MEIRAQVAYHFKIDPAKLAPGLIRLPEQITRTVSVGEEMTTEKISLASLPGHDQADLKMMLDILCREATRTARPQGAAPLPDIAAEPEAEELSAF